MPNNRPPASRGELGREAAITPTATPTTVATTIPQRASSTVAGKWLRMMAHTVCPWVAREVPKSSRSSWPR